MHRVILVLIGILLLDVSIDCIYIIISRSKSIFSKKEMNLLFALLITLEISIGIIVASMYISMR